MRFVLISALFVGTLLGACGGAPPPPARGVVEADMDGWKFRRFQGPLLDVEVWIDGNKGVAHSASYITVESEKRGQIRDEDLVNVTVTKYETDAGIVREMVRFARRLAAEKGYQVDEQKVEGVRLLAITGPAEAWVLWPATNYIVKIGGQGRTSVPSSIVEDYGERYASRLPGGSLEGPLPEGPAAKPEKVDPKDPYDANAPKPDLDNYDPDKVKLPGSDPKIDSVGDEDNVDAQDKPAADEKPAKPKKKKKKK